MFEDPKYYTKLEKMENPKSEEKLYYLKDGNIIKENTSNVNWKIVGVDKDGVHLTSHSALAHKIVDKKLLTLTFAELVNLMDNKTIRIHEHPYENDRDKVLLENEIAKIESASRMGLGGGINLIFGKSDLGTIVTGKQIGRAHV